MKNLIDPDRPLSGSRSEFNLCMRAVKEGWVTGEDAECLVSQAIEYAKQGQLPLRQFRQLLTALHKLGSPLLNQLAAMVDLSHSMNPELRILIDEYSTVDQSHESSQTKANLSQLS